MSCSTVSPPGSPSTTGPGTCCTEDLGELRDIGYLTLAVPGEFGGAGLTLHEVAGEQRRLAYRSPATAKAVNTHLYVTGAAADAHRLGDTSAEWLLREAAGGAIFAAGHDLALAHSNVRAEPEPDGGYRFHGRKTLTPVAPDWTWLGLHALDDSSPGNPKGVYAFIRRDAPGCQVIETSGTLGTRPGKSGDTVLDGVRAEAQHVARVIPAGPPADPFIFAIFCWALPLLGTIHYAVAERAFDLAIDSARRRTQQDLSAHGSSHRPYAEWTIADALLEVGAISFQLGKVTRDWPAGVDHAARSIIELFAARRVAVESAKRVVDLAIESVGCGDFRAGEELARLYRDVHDDFTPAAHEA